MRDLFPSMSTEENRAQLARSIAETVLGLGGMEEDASWTMYRVLYVPVSDTGRVCVRIPVERIEGISPQDWGLTGMSPSEKVIRVSCRIRVMGPVPYDRIIRSRDVRIRGDARGIVSRVRKAVIEGTGLVRASV